MLVEKYIFCINPSQLWFLWMLLGVFAIVWPLWKSFTEDSFVGMILAIVFYGVGIIGNQLLPNIFCIWTACRYIPFFYIGMRIRKKQENNEKLIINKVPWYSWLIFDLTLYITSLVIEETDNPLIGFINISISFLLYVVGAIMAFVILQKIGIHTHWQKNKIFKELVSCSMPMYLFHQQLIYFTIYWFNGKINPYIHVGINLIVAVMVSYFISKLLMRWNVTRMLIGEK